MDVYPFAAEVEATVRSMETADQQQYDAEVRDLMYDQLAERWGPDVARDIWGRACAIYDRDHALSVD